VTSPSLSLSLIIHKSQILCIQRQLFPHSLLVSASQSSMRRGKAGEECSPFTELTPSGGGGEVVVHGELSVVQKLRVSEDEER
jgi:hypothetical protein